MESATVSTKPLTREETKVLLGFIESSRFINNKQTNATSNKLKIEEWKRIADHFNAVVGSSYRTPQQLRLKWENLKKNSRKRNTQIRMNNIKTGGGAPQYIPPDDVLDRVAALLGSTVDGFTVSYGGDAEQVPENDSDPGFVGVTNIVTGNEVLQEFLVSDAGPCSPPREAKNFISTPRASGFKRKIKTDENRAARNQAITDYYLMKTKILEANLEHTLLENKKLKLEIEKLQNKD